MRGTVTAVSRSAAHTFEKSRGAGIRLLAGLGVEGDAHMGETFEVTGLRNPCKQLDGFQPGLMAAGLDRDEDGSLIRKAGIMGVVLTGGEVRPGDEISVVLPSGPFHPLETV